MSDNARTIPSPSSSASPLAWAQWYAEALGWACFPCNPLKEPTCKRGFRAATTDPEELGRHWRVSPGSALGTCTPVVLDVDPRNGGDASLSEWVVRFGPLPETPSARTGGGGLHFFFAAPEGGARWNGEIPGFPGLDVKGGDRGYVILPPSRSTFGAYTWQVAPWDTPLAPMPEALLPFVLGLHKKAIPAESNREKRAFTGERSAYAKRAFEMEMDAVRRSPGGQRNAQLNRSAFSLGQLHAGGEIDDVRDDLYEAARFCGLLDDPDDGPARTRATIESGWTAGALEPRNRPSPNGNGSTPHRSADGDALDLSGFLAVCRKWLHIPDLDPFLAVLGTAIANRCAGDPVWLLVIAPPGHGKTELIWPLTALSDVHPASTLTEAGLLSGTPNKERTAGSKGGLLRLIGDRGILLLKDFGSILSMNRESRAAVLAALREIYDGSWTRHVGADGGKTLEWSGRIGFIAGCTPSIDSHHSVMASLGERFLLIRMKGDNSTTQTERALEHAGNEAQMRRELAEAVVLFLDAIEIPTEVPTLSEKERDGLVNLCSLVCRCRSAVERDSYRREIELIPGAESPTRFAIGMLRLLTGLLAIGVPRKRAWRVIRRIGFDSMPALRFAVLKKLLDLDRTQSGIGTGKLARELGYPTPTARRALEDLAVYGVVTRYSQGEGKEDLWTLGEHEREVLSTVSEKSDGDISIYDSTNNALEDFSEKVGGESRGNERDLGKTG